MELTKITHENEKAFLSMLPGSAAKPSENVIRLGILDDRCAAAGALSAKRYDGFIDVMSLYIVPDHRRQGYGRELINRLFEAASSLKLGAVTGEFLEDEASKGFAEAMGCDLFQGKRQYSFSMGNFLRSPLYKRLLKGKDDHQAPFVSTLSLNDRKILDNHTGHVFYDPSWSTACIEKGMYKSCLLADHEYEA